MSRQLVLFAGLHRTGTTSIQRTCAANQPAIHEAGFAYPVFLRGASRMTNHSTAFHYMFRRDPRRAGYLGQGVPVGHANPAVARNGYRELVASVLSRSTRVLMVAESISLLSVDELNELKGWFNERGYDIRLICYVRRLSSWINSMVSQRVTFQYLPIKSSIGEFRSGPGIVRSRIITIKAVFPDAECYSFEAALKHPKGPVGFFLESIGINQTEKTTFVKANEGRSDCATRLISALSETIRPLLVSGGLKWGDVDNEFSGLKAIPGRRFSLRLDEVPPLLPVLIEENEWLRETLGEDFYDTELAFHDEPCYWHDESLTHLRKVYSALTERVRSLISSYLAGLGISLAAK